jgi:hypothetical protein
LIDGFLDLDVPFLTWEKFDLIQPNIHPAFGGQLAVEVSA